MTDNDNEKGKEVSLSWFIEPLLKYKHLYIEMIGLAICVRLLALVEPFIFQVIIDRVLPFQREETLIVIVAILVAVFIFQMHFGIVSTLLGVRTANKVTHEFAQRIFDHLFKLPLNHLRKRPVGETIARTGEVETIRTFLIGTTTGITLDILFLIIYLGILLTISTQLTMIVLASLPIQILVYYSFGPTLRKRLRIQFDAGAKHQSEIVESLSGAISIKSISAEKNIEQKLTSSLRDMLRSAYRLAILNLWSGNITMTLQRVVSISILYFGANLVFRGEITLGQLIAFNMLVGGIIAPINNFTTLWESWQNIKISRQRLGDILNMDKEPFDEYPNLPKIIEPRLVFEKVHFYYIEESPIIRDFDFDALPNSLTLIIGPSGIGKSTFGRLASGIEHPQGGRILLGGENIAEYDPHDVRAKVAYIPQEPFLFSGTIRDNLTIGEEDATPEQMLEALKKAAADTLVEKLPKGLDTDVGERGSALSGGQRQRIAIARSLIKKPKVIILDEPTSALDDAAQRKLAQEIIRLKKTATIIIITHRLDVFGEPDQIIDFEKAL